MSKDAGGALVGCVGGVLFVVDGDAGEQGAVEDPSFGWFALVVEVVEIDEEFGELVQACSGVAVGEVVEPCADLVEADADAVLFALEAFGFELVAFGSQELAFVLAGSFELVEHVVEDLPDVLGLGWAQGVALVGAFDLGSRLTDEQAQAVIDSDAFGALTAELRRAEANHHNVEALLPRLIAARGFADADDIASVIHHRLANATARPAGSGRTRQAPRLIAGLIPEAAGPMTPDMQQALAERRHLIETRAQAVLDTALHTHEPWVTALGPIPPSGRERQQW